jgi:hypothetical protein
MRKIVTLAVAIAASVSALFTTPASADVLVGDFNVLNGNPSATAGQITFTLNGNGTIAASLVSYVGTIYGFGFDSATHYTSFGFVGGTAQDTSWGDYYGTHRSGFYSNGLTSVTWTFGVAGQFTSVYQAITGTNASYDFMITGGAPGGDYGANAHAPVAAPAPGALALLGLGLMGLGAARRKAKAA